MPQPLPEIQGVDNTQNWLAATRAGITDRQLLQNQEIQNQNRLLNQNVGNALAGGDLDEASNIAARGGNIDLYGQLQKWSKQASDDELADAQKKHELTANLLANIKTPQQLEMALGVAQNTKAISPDDAARIRDQVQKFGLEPTLQYHAAVVGKQNDAIAAAQAQRQQSNKDIGQSFAALSPDDEAGHVQVLQNLAKQGNSQAAQYLTPEGELVPGARASALGQAGLGSDVMSNQAKAALAAARGGKGGGKPDTVQKITDEYAEQNPGKKLPYSLALSTANALQAKFSAGAVLSGWKNDENGNPVEPIWTVPKNTALGQRGMQYDPEARYKAQYGKKAADVDASQLGREQQSVIVGRHYDVAADIAGGWQTDNSKLSPEQLQQRQEFEAAVGPIRGRAPEMTKIIAGELNPDSSTPPVISELASINQMIKGETTRLATMGQGAVAEGVRHDFDAVVGNFLTSPSTGSYLRVLNFGKKLMSSFQDVPNVGKEAVQKLKGEAATPEAGIEARASHGGKNYVKRNGQWFEE